MTWKHPVIPQGPLLNSCCVVISLYHVVFFLWLAKMILSSYQVSASILSQNTSGCILKQWAAGGHFLVSHITLLYSALININNGYQHCFTAAVFIEFDIWNSSSLQVIFQRFKLDWKSQAKKVLLVLLGNLVKNVGNNKITHKSGPIGWIILSIKVFFMSIKANCDGSHFLGSIWGKSKSNWFSWCTKCVSGCHLPFLSTSHSQSDYYMLLCCDCIWM